MRFSAVVRRAASVLALVVMLFCSVPLLADDAGARMQPPLPVAPPTPLEDAKMQPPIPAPTAVRLILFVIATRLGLPVR